MFHRFHTGTWQRRASGRVPTRFIPVRVARATVTMAVLRICALLLLFDCQEAFHCCLVVACINRINMISIECHRSGERCPGKREFDNRIEINRVRSGEIDVAIPFNVNSRNKFCNRYIIQLIEQNLVINVTHCYIHRFIYISIRTIIIFTNNQPTRVCPVTCKQQLQINIYNICLEYLH